MVWHELTVRLSGADSYRFIACEQMNPFMLSRIPAIFRDGDTNPRARNLTYVCRVPPRHEGRFAIVTIRGAGCGGRVRRQIRHMKSAPDDDSAARGRLKSCGPGAAMLASNGDIEPSLRSRRRRKIVVSRTVAKEPVHRGERETGRSNHRVRNAG